MPRPTAAKGQNCSSSADAGNGRFGRNRTAVRMKAELLYLVSRHRELRGALSYNFPFWKGFSGNPEVPNRALKSSRPVRLFSTSSARSDSPDKYSARLRLLAGPESRCGAHHQVRTVLPTKTCTNGKAAARRLANHSSAAARSAPARPAKRCGADCSDPQPVLSAGACRKARQASSSGSATRPRPPAPAGQQPS